MQKSAIALALASAAQATSPVMMPAPEAPVIEQTISVGLPDPAKYHADGTPKAQIERIEMVEPIRYIEPIRVPDAIQQQVPQQVPVQQVQATQPVQQIQPPVPPYVKEIDTRTAQFDQWMNKYFAPPTSANATMTPAEQQEYQWKQQIRHDIQSQIALQKQQLLEDFLLEKASLENDLAQIAQSYRGTTYGVPNAYNQGAHYSLMSEVRVPQEAVQYASGESGVSANPPSVPAKAEAAPEKKDVVVREQVMVGGDPRALPPVAPVEKIEKIAKVEPQMIKEEPKQVKQEAPAKPVESTTTTTTVSGNKVVKKIVTQELIPYEEPVAETKTTETKTTETKTAEAKSAETAVTKAQEVTKIGVAPPIVKQEVQKEVVGVTQNLGKVQDVPKVVPVLPVAQVQPMIQPKPLVYTPPPVYANLVHQANIEFMEEQKEMELERMEEAQEMIIMQRQQQLLEFKRQQTQQAIDHMKKQQVANSLSQPNQPGNNIMNAVAQQQRDAIIAQQQRNLLNIERQLVDQHMELAELSANGRTQALGNYLHKKATELKCDACAHPCLNALSSAHHAESGMEHLSQCLDICGCFTVAPKAPQFPHARPTLVLNQELESSYNYTQAAVSMFVMTAAIAGVYYAAKQYGKRSVSDDGLDAYLLIRN